MPGPHIAGARCAGAGCEASPLDTKAPGVDLGPALQSSERRFRTGHNLVLFFYCDSNYMDTQRVFAFAVAVTSRIKSKSIVSLCTLYILLASESVRVLPTNAVDEMSRIRR